MSITGLSLATSSKRSRRSSYRRRLEAIGLARCAGRGLRFLKRHEAVSSGPEISFGDVATLPEWTLLDEETIVEVASMASLLHFRRQIDLTLDGETLRELCQHVGEHNLDAACAVPLPPDTTLAPTESVLPAPELMNQTGRKLISKSLPAVMNVASAEAANDPFMKELANLATEIVLASKSPDIEVANQ